MARKFAIIKTNDFGPLSALILSFSFLKFHYYYCMDFYVLEIRNTKKALPHIISESYMMPA